MQWRILAAVAALVSATAHFKLWLDGMSDIHVIGPAFLVNAVAGVVIAGLLLTWRTSWVPGFLVAGFGASTFGAFIISASVGLFGHKEVWSGTYVWVAAASEIICILGGAFVFLAGWRLRAEIERERSA